MNAAPIHASDCAVHNEPYAPNGPCDCGVVRTIPSIFSHVCTRCGLSLRRAMFMAALYDAGAQGNIDPLNCHKPDGALAEHDFQPPTQT